MQQALLSLLQGINTLLAMWKAGLCLLAAATLAAAQNRDLLMRDLQAVSVVENVNLLYPAQYGPGTLDLPATYPGAQRTVSGLLPDQVRVCRMVAAQVHGCPPLQSVQCLMSVNDCIASGPLLTASCAPDAFIPSATCDHLNHSMAAAFLWP